MMKTTARIARKRRRCTSCEGRILAGETYLEHVASPDHDILGNEGWWRSPECSTCATRYGRGDQIEARTA